MRSGVKVTLAYGPYESGAIVQHKTFRLQGLQAALTAHGHQCVLQQTDEWNTVEVVVRGALVFKCQIQELEFGGDGKLDPVCERAVAAVENCLNKERL